MWLGVDGISIERIDLCARSVSQSIPSYNRTELCQLDCREWEIEFGFLGFGASAAAVKDGACGAPVLN